MLPGPALIQADLNYQRADVDQKIQDYVAASQGHSVELDSAFIMGIEIGLPILMSFQTNFYFLCQVGQMFLNKWDCSGKFSEAGFAGYSY